MPGTVCGGGALAIALGLAVQVAPAGEGQMPQPRPQLDREKTPGRQVRVAAIAIGMGGAYEKKLKLALEHLESAGSQGVDIACLPEEFAGTKAETIPGPTTRAVAEVAKKHNLWVVCPIREQAGDEQFNTAVLIDRQGKVAGCYRKVFAFWGEGVNASRDGVKVFDTDFGRISILTCFDLNFAELWLDAEKQGAEIVFWPSAYGGGAPLNGHATIHGYCIVAAGCGNIIDATGQTLKEVEKPREQQSIATLDLDRAFVHKDFTGEKIKKLVDKHKGEIELEKDCAMENWYLLRSIKAGVRVRDLCKEYGIELLREYRHRSREQINEARRNGKRI